MKEHPILFSTPMVKAILDGRKTVTRRIFKHQPNHKATIIERSDRWPKQGDWIAKFRYPGELPRYEVTDVIRCPFGKVGDNLWVRETFCTITVEDRPLTLYKADGDLNTAVDVFRDGKPWHPSIHMPKDVCRLFLKITGVSVERLQDITEEDAKKEGWEKINGEGLWIANPWVWVIHFRRKTDLEMAAH